MPSWLIPILVNLAIKLGVPALVKYLPWIPQAVIDAINELLNALKDPNKSNSQARKEAMVKVYGAVGNAPEVKKN